MISEAHISRKKGRESQGKVKKGEQRHDEWKGKENIGPVEGRGGENESRAVHWKCPCCPHKFTFKFVNKSNYLTNFGHNIWTYLDR